MVAGFVSFSQRLSAFHHSTKNGLSSPSPKVQTNASEKEEEEEEEEGVGEGEEQTFNEKVVNALGIDRTNFQHFNFQNLATL